MRALNRFCDAYLVLALLAAFSLSWMMGCGDRYGRVSIEGTRVTPSSGPLVADQHKIDRVKRYGGTVLTAKGMPHGEHRAYLWAKNMGTLVAYETFLRRYSEGKYAEGFRQVIRKRFVPDDDRWQEAWTLYSKMEIIDGAIVDPKEGFILIGRRGNGKLSPFFYDDLITALVCSLNDEKVAVTMTRIFEADFRQPKEPGGYEWDTSVEFFSDLLWNTHLSYILFEADRMLKSLGAGYDIFLREEVRSKVPGFKTQIEMEAAQPMDETRWSGMYGRVWIELTDVLFSTTEEKNVAMFSDFAMEVRAESEHEPPIRFAKHLRENYATYADEFPIFAEVEREARIVAIARWLTRTYPSVAQRLVDDAYQQVEVYVPQIIEARSDVTHKTATWERSLIGGVTFPPINRYAEAPEFKVEDTQIREVPERVRQAMPDSWTQAWEVFFDEERERQYIAWNPEQSESLALGRGDMSPVARK